MHLVQKLLEQRDNRRDDFRVIQEIGANHRHRRSILEQRTWMIADSLIPILPLPGVTPRHLCRNTVGQQVTPAVVNRPIVSVRAHNRPASQHAR